MKVNKSVFTITIVNLFSDDKRVVEYTLNKDIYDESQANQACRILVDLDNQMESGEIVISYIEKSYYNNGITEYNHLTLDTLYSELGLLVSEKLYDML